MLPHYAIANNDDFTVTCAQDSAKLYAFAMVELRQVIAPDRDGHVTGYGAHGSQERQPTLRILHCLVGYGGGVLLEQGVGQGLGRSGQLQICNENLLLEIVLFLCEWLLDLQYQVGIPRLLYRNSVGSCITILRIREA